MSMVVDSDPRDRIRYTSVTDVKYMSSNYSSTKAIFDNLSKGNYSAPVLSLGSVGIFLYLLELITIVIWIVANRVHMGIFIWKIKEVINKYDIKVPHFIFLPLVITCLYKFTSIGVLMYRQSTLSIGPEIVCFLMFDVVIYDSIFSLLLLVFCSILIKMPISKKILITLRVSRVLICICVFAMLLNSIYTSVIVCTVENADVLGILMYSITMPVMGITRLILLVIATSLSIGILILNKTARVLTIRIGCILIICIISNICFVILVLLSYLLGIIALLILHIIPGLMTNLIVIIAFAPNKSTWKRLLHMESA